MEPVRPSPAAPDLPPAAPDLVPGRVKGALLVGTSLVLAWILLPFFGPILWAGVLALLFGPWNRRLTHRLGNRRNLAALLTLAAMAVIVILPLALLTVALVSEATTVYARMQSGELAPLQYFRELFAALPRAARELLGRFGMINFAGLQRRLDAALASASPWMAGQAFGAGQYAVDLVLELGITLYLAFFFVRDGEAMLRLLRRAVPLPPSQLQELTDKFCTVIRATVRGNLLVALVQGALGGLAFWFLGVDAALLWTMLMVALSLVPAVGAALVWVPVALYFLATGALWQAAALLAWGVLVIGLADNLLRPLLVGRDTGIPDWLVLLSTLGGLAVMGPKGLVLGPVTAAMFIAVWHLHLAPRERPAP